MATNALQPGHRGRHFVVSWCPTVSSVWPGARAQRAGALWRGARRPRPNGCTEHGPTGRAGARGTNSQVIYARLTIELDPGSCVRARGHAPPAPESRRTRRRPVLLVRRTPSYADARRHGRRHRAHTSV
eukprot:3454417-Prymnesium_polylepis.1